MNIVQDINSLTSFKRNTTSAIRRLKKTGDPLVLTQNGKAEIVVQSAEAYQRMLDLIEQAEVVEAIRLGIEQMRDGKTVDAFRAMDKMRKEFKIPRDA